MHRLRSKHLIILLVALVSGIVALLSARPNVATDAEQSELARERPTGLKSRPLSRQPGIPSAVPPVRPLVESPVDVSSPPVRQPFLEGFVRSRTGVGVNYAVVWYQIPGRGQVSTWTDEDGSFRLSGPNVLPVQVYAARHAYLPSATSKWTADGLTTPLVIEAGQDLPIRFESPWEDRMESPSLIPTSEEDRSMGYRIPVWSGSSGFVAGGVDTATAYDIWVPPSRDAMFVLATSVYFSRDGITLRASKATSYVEVDVVAPTEVKSVFGHVVLRRGLAVVGVTGDLSTRLRIGPLPRGRWHTDIRSSKSEGRKWMWVGMLSTDEPTQVVLAQE